MRNNIKNIFFNRSRILPWLVLILCLTTTSIFYFQSVKLEQTAQQHYINTTISELVNDVHLQLQLYEKLLLREVAIFTLSPKISAKKWHQHLENIKLHERYKEIQNIGFFEFLQEPYSDRPLRYLAPFTQTQSLGIGYNIHLNPLYDDAIKKAVERSEAMLSPNFIPSTAKQTLDASYVMYQPLYRNNIIPDTIEKRKRFAQGAIFLTFNLANFVEEIINKRMSSVKLTIYDTSGGSNPHLIYSKVPSTFDTTSSQMLSKDLKLAIKGISWEFHLQSSTIPPSKTRTSPMLLTMGVIVSLLLFLLFMSISLSNNKAKRLARAKTQTIRQLNEDLRNSSQQYSVTFQQANIGIANVSIDSSMIDVNIHLCDMLGFTYEELLHLKLKDIIHPTDWALTLLLLEDLLENSELTSRIENRLIHKDGSAIWCDLTISLIRSTLNRTLYFIATIQDISSQKQHIRDLNDQKEEFERIIQISPTPIMLHAEDGEVLMINQAWEELSGYSHEDIPTIEQWTYKAYGKAQSTLKEHINALYETQTRIDTGEFEVNTKSGKKIHWHFSAAPMWRNEDGRRMLISTAMDITALRTKENMLISQSRQAAMGEMISMIAHQWRQPLTSIGMLINNLLLCLELEADISNEYLNGMSSDILNLVEHLSCVVNDFKDFFKPIQDKEHASIDKIFNNVSTIIVKGLEDCNIEVIFNNQSQGELYTYPNALLQIFVNLIQNSKDAIIEQNSGKGSITITVSEIKDLIKITVCDTGGGIHHKNKEHIGQPYFSTKSKNGTGLGLYMSKTILEKHLKGTLTWENDKQGVCFTLLFPRLLDEDDAVHLKDKSGNLI